jgi:hypothetical protein
MEFDKRYFLSRSDIIRKYRSGCNFNLLHLRDRKTGMHITEFPVADRFI